MVVDKSGMIVDTPSWSDGLNADMVVRIVEAFGIDIVVVVGNERIYSELSKVLFDQGRTTSILQLSKSGGVRFQLEIFSIASPCFLLKGCGKGRTLSKVHDDETHS